MDSTPQPIIFPCQAARGPYRRSTLCPKHRRPLTALPRSATPFSPARCCSPRWLSPCGHSAKSSTSSAAPSVRSLSPTSRSHFRDSPSSGISRPPSSSSPSSPPSVFFRTTFSGNFSCGCLSALSRASPASARSTTPSAKSSPRSAAKTATSTTRWCSSNSPAPALGRSASSPTRRKAKPSSKRGSANSGPSSFPPPLTPPAATFSCFRPAKSSNSK